jgi:hypothetical protein
MKEVKVGRIFRLDVETRNIYRSLVGKSLGKPLRR